MTITVRKLSATDDLAAASELLQRFFAEEGFSTPAEAIARNTQTLAGLENCGLFAAEQGGSVIGVASVSLEFGVEFGWSAEMGDLYVVPEWRGKGVSRLLVAALEKFLRTRGATGYQVTVTPYAEQHHGLAGFYDRLGFASEGRLILYKQLRT